MRLWSTILAAFVAAPLLGGYASTDSWFPAVGRATGVGGREFFTTIYLTNMSDREAAVTLSFFRAAQPSAAPREAALQLAPRASATHEVTDFTSGSLRLKATQPVLATARAYSRGAGGDAAAVFNAIPAQFAIGSGESTLVQTARRDTRCRLYVAETHGFPLYFSVTLGDVSRRLYVGPHEQRSWDFSGAPLRVAGVNGSGKIVVAVAQDNIVYEMALPTAPRHRIGWSERLAWIAAAVALIVAGLRR